MLIPDEAFKIKIGEKLENPGFCKVKNTGGLPNIDDGYFQGIPLGGFGTGAFTHSYRGDFSLWNLEIGKHLQKHFQSCQFGFYENGNAFILNDFKSDDKTLSKWNFKKQNGTYHALYPFAYFDYEDLGITLEEFSPIIPHNYQETAYPVAIFKWHIKNTTNIERKISLLWTWKSFFGSKENFFYQENSFSGIIFDNITNNLCPSFGQTGMFIQREDTEITYINSFDENGDGSEVWNSFSKKGMLSIEDSSKLNKENSPAALCAAIKILPGDKKTITFILVWDFPVFETGSKTLWYKKYTDFYGKDGRAVTNIARKTIGENERWILEIKKWQNEILKTNKPSWFKTLLLNELYYNVAGGTIWTTGRLVENKSSNTSIIKKEEHFGMLECFDYPFYETLDVRFYGSFPILKLWADLEKLVMKDFIKSILKEDKEEVFFNHPLFRKKGERKIKGAAPHDLGSINENPFLKYNSYPHTNINLWKDLNSKFVLLIYRYFYFTSKKDIEFLQHAWEAVFEAINYLKTFDRDNDGLIENDGIPDQTYDNWAFSGPGSYCNGLWLASLKATIEIAKILNKEYKVFEEWFKIGKKNLEEKLWNGEYYLLSLSEVNKNIVMADALCGQWYGDLLGLGEIFNSERVKINLTNIFNKNVLGIKEGKVGAINGINFNGEILKDSEVWKENTQWNEIWTGTTLGLASLMDLNGMKEESLQTAFGIYKTIYGKGYFFRTPEAWDINGNFRASMYHRPGAVWAFKL